MLRDNRELMMQHKIDNFEDFQKVYNHINITIAQLDNEWIKNGVGKSCDL